MDFNLLAQRLAEISGACSDLTEKDLNIDTVAEIKVRIQGQLAVVDQWLTEKLSPSAVLDPTLGPDTDDVRLMLTDLGGLAINEDHPYNETFNGILNCRVLDFSGKRMRWLTEEIEDAIVE